MKLSEVAQLQRDAATREWLHSHDVRDFEINPDGTVDVHNGVDLTHILETELPVQFRRVEGSFDCYNANLTSLKGFPYWIAGHLYLFDSHIYSLHNIHKMIKYVGGEVSGREEVTHLLGLLLIDGVKNIHFTDEKTRLDEILNKYLPTHDVISAQDELIDAGFIEQAKL